MPEPLVAKVLVHASCVALGDRGLLILGPSGSGKSDLVLALLDQPGFGTGNELLHGRLVADDQTVVEGRGKALFASSPKPLKGLLEIRGQGIVKVESVPQARLALAVRLMPVAEIERMPEQAEATFEIAGLALPQICIDPKQATAAARVRAALTAIPYEGLRQKGWDRA